MFHDTFAANQAVVLTPTLKFYDAQGREIVEEIEGFTNHDFYGYYLDERIDQALARLRAVAVIESP